MISEKEVFIHISNEHFFLSKHLNAIGEKKHKRLTGIIDSIFNKMHKRKRKLWEFPWQYKESILFIAGFVTVGFILQLTVGKFNFFFFQSPVNLAAGVLMIACIVCLSFLRETAFYKWFSGVPFSVTLIAALTILGIIMGLTPQVLHIHEHQTDIFTLLGFKQMTSSWAFVLLYLILLLSLGSLIMRRLISFKLKDYAFYLNHIGLWILLFAAGLGAADTKRYVMHIPEGEVEWRVYSENKDVLELPIAIQLNDFDMEEYPPKLTVIDRKTGIPQPEGKPLYYQIDEKVPMGDLFNWEVTVEKYIHDAVRNSDSTYREVPMIGSTPAAYVKLKSKQNDEEKSGWVCGGNMAQLYMTLPVDSQYTVVMTEPEPKHFQSDVNVFTEDGKETHAIIEVNKPLKMGNWMIYQYGYDTDARRMSSYSSLELVYDPWIIPAYIGIFMLALGCICLFWSGNNKRIKKDDVE